MADLQLQAAKVSSLARALEGSVDLKHDVPAVPKSSPIKGFETLVIPSSKAVAIDKREVHNISLPKMGQIVSMFAQYTYTGVVTHGGTADRTYAAKEGPALANTEIVRLLSNSRELSRMTSQDILIKTKGLPAETRDALLRMNGSELHLDAYMKPATGSDPLRIKSGQTTKREIVVLCPLPFACAFPGAGAAGQIDASFLEELQVEITTRPAQEAFQSIGSNSSKATACSLSLVVNYSQMDDKHRQKMIAAAYKPGKPLQILSTSYELLGSETKTKSKNALVINTADDGGTYQPETFRFRSSSSCMARAIHYYVSPDEEQTITTTTASVVALFQDTISAVVALAVFMPVVAGMGGNAATQTLAVIVRGIALGELTWSNSRKALIKEGLVGLGNGTALGLVAAGGAYLLRGDPVLGLILGLAMVINMFVAATAQFSPESPENSIRTVAPEGM